MSRVSGVAELIRITILSGEHRPGAGLIEPELAESLRARRSTIREALRRLEGEGLLTADDSGGMRVIRLDERDLVATLELRAALEALTAGLAAERVRQGAAPARDVEALRAPPAGGGWLRGGSETDAALLADRQFHRAVAALGANRPARRALEHVWDRIVIAASSGVAGAERVPADEADHRELVTAIGAGDAAGASEVARRHARAVVPGARVPDARRGVRSRA
jgi:DNA-binding GntR family transcriptional regulator